MNLISSITISTCIKTKTAKCYDVLAGRSKLTYLVSATNYPSELLESVAILRFWCQGYTP